MTDLEKLLSILDPDQYSDKSADYELTPYKVNYPNASKVIEVDNSVHLGYSGFLSVWLFDSEGRYLGLGHYE